MYNPFFSNILSLLISVSGNVLLLWFFLRALFSPIEYADFIFNTGMLLFLIEFLSIHSGFMIFNMAKGGGKIGTKEFLSNVGWSDPFNGKVGEWLGIRGVKFFVLSIYSLFSVIYALAFKNWFIPLYFFISLVSKIFGGKAMPHAWKMYVQLGIFMGSVMAIALFSAQIVLLFPMPEEIFVQKHPNSSGAFVDTPQTLLVWGVVYFSLLIIAEIVLFGWEVKKMLSTQNTHEAA